jgi:hypothetical protein
MSRAYSTDPARVKRRVLIASSKLMPNQKLFLSDRDKRVYRAIRMLTGYMDLREMREHSGKRGKFRAKQVKKDCLLLGVSAANIDEALKELRECGLDI